jgi:hypothetical protein
VISGWFASREGFTTTNHRPVDFFSHDFNVRLTLLQRSPRRVALTGFPSFPLFLPGPSFHQFPQEEVT